MNSSKKGEGVQLLNLKGGPGVPLLNFEGGPGSRGFRSRRPGPTFTPCHSTQKFKYLRTKKAFKMK